MILLDVLVTDIVFETVRFIVLVALMVAGVLVGKKLRDRSDSKNAPNTAKELQDDVI